MPTLMNYAASGAGVSTIYAGLNITVFPYIALFFFFTKEFTSRTKTAENRVLCA